MSLDTAKPTIKQGERQGPRSTGSGSRFDTGPHESAAADTLVAWR